MSWSDHIDAINTAVINSTTGVGDVVTLPSGVDVSGIFELRSMEPESPWPETGLAAPVSRESTPGVWMIEGDASGLVVGALLTIKGAQYRVTAPALPDGTGLVWLELAEQRKSADGERWQ